MTNIRGHVTGLNSEGVSTQNENGDFEMTHPAVGKRCIIRGYGSGVHLGTVDSVETNGMFSRAVVTDARRIRYWCGSKEKPARSLSEVAITGIDTKKSQVHMNEPVKYIEDCIEFMPATPEAISSIEAATSESK
jgi:hypothetical protein